MEPKRTPGQAEGSVEDVEAALSTDPKRRSQEAQQLRDAEAQEREREPGRTPGQAEGSVEAAEGSLRNQNKQ